MKLTEHHRAFEKTLRQISHRHERWRVFADFCEMAALSLANAFPHPQREALEARYLETVRRYDAEEAQGLAQLFGITTQALEAESDFLGEMFMHLELSSKWGGQFFTPYVLSQAIAELSLAGVAQTLERQEFITVQEPAAGSGGLVIAVANVLAQRHINYQQRLHVTAVDVDPTAAYMAYVQLSLLGVPAVVYVGNTLSMELRQELKTFMHYLGLWDHKLRRGPRAVGESREPTLDLGAARQADLFEDVREAV